MPILSGSLRHACPLGRSAAILALISLGALAPTARADVTVRQQTTLSLAGMKIDMNSVERTAGGKQRRDTTTSCHGFLALFCHNVQSGEIVRLDRQLEWRLDPKHETYMERAFPTPEQRAQAQQQLQAAIEKMKQCPMPRPQNASASAPDTSQCQLSPPVVSVKRTDEHATILGHDTRKATVVLSQTCTNAQTGDVCEMDYGFDTWLTADDLPGESERMSFTKQYLAAQGLDPSDSRLRGMVQQLMAPYADQLKQLRGKASALTGHPLRTTFYMAFGGPHCSRAKQAQQQQASSGGARPGLGSIASSALRGGLGGLFHRAAGAIHADSAGGAAAAGAANEAAEPAAGAATDAAMAGSVPAAGGGGSATAPSSMIKVISLTSETTSIDTTSIASDQFEIPAGWKRRQPAQVKTSDKLDCPTAQR